MPAAWERCRPINTSSLIWRQVGSVQGLNGLEWCLCRYSATSHCVHPCTDDDHLTEQKSRIMLLLMLGCPACQQATSSKGPQCSPNTNSRAELLCTTPARMSGLMPSHTAGVMCCQTNMSLHFHLTLSSHKAAAGVDVSVAELLPEYMRAQ